MHTVKLSIDGVELHVEGVQSIHSQIREYSVPQRRGAAPEGERVRRGRVVLQCCQESLTGAVGAIAGQCCDLAIVSPSMALGFAGGAYGPARVTVQRNPATVTVEEL